MTLDAFLKQVRKETKEFEKRWKAGMKKDPQHWPESMPEPDWYEQFITHIQESSSDG